MILHELYMKGFGQFHNRRISLHPGINLICGKNESGKSTIAVFIKAMLFGLKKGRGRAAGRDTFGRYNPWDENFYGGSMEFSCRDRRFRLERVFPDSEELLCTDDGEQLDVSAGDLTMLLGGVQEGMYRNALQTTAEDDFAGAELKAYLEDYFLNMESVQEEAADVQSALKYLKERRREAESELKLRRKIREEQEAGLKAKIEYISEEAEKLGMNLKEESEAVVHQEKIRVPDEQNRGGAVWYLLTAAVLASGAAYFVSLHNYILASGMAVGGLLFGLLYIIKVIKKRKARMQKAEELEQKHRQESERMLLERDIRRRNLEESLRERLREKDLYREELRELAEMSEEEKRLRLDISACIEAGERIKAAAERLTGDWGRRLEQAASEILAALTAGRYQGLRFEEQMGITVTDGKRVYAPFQLSTGTKEQIRMSVRLAAAMFLSEEPMPFVFDDAFLTWDDERLGRMLDWLSVCGRQVLIFTGGNREERLFAERNIPIFKIILDE